MIDPESVQAVRAAQFNQHFIRPLYDTYNFSRIPQTVRSLLIDGKPKGIPFGERDDLCRKYDAVVLFFIDAFGWRFFEQYYERFPFLKRIVEEGLALKLTSQFPSTTAAHVTTIHTGLPVGVSGVYEWFYYEPKLDRMIAPLLFSYADERTRETLRHTGVAPDELFPRQTLYQELKQSGVRTILLQHQNYAFSSYTRVVTRGAKIVPYRTLPEALVNLTQLIQEQRDTTYYFLYFDSIDATCHYYGPNSLHLAAEIELFLTAMEQVFHRLMSDADKRMLMLLTADHGQVAIDPATTVYLNQRLPSIQRLLKTNAADELLVPAGSSRDLFLHIKDAHLDETQAVLQRELAGKADVYTTQTLIEQNMFGTITPSDEFLNRVGNLVILPYAGESVWWYEKGKFEQIFYGSHGGLTREEMEIPLLVYAYS
jgi:predicted AlkP superfamily pyrophosphatase or phosphodiesterase